MNTIPTDYVGCNVYQTDRFRNDYKLNKGEQMYALFCTCVLTIGMLFMLIHWMFQIATD